MFHDKGMKNLKIKNFIIKISGRGDMTDFLTSKGGAPSASVGGLRRILIANTGILPYYCSKSESHAAN